jgi:hypothetical protein
MYINGRGSEPNVPFSIYLLSSHCTIKEEKLKEGQCKKEAHCKKERLDGRSFWTI